MTAENPFLSIDQLAANVLISATSEPDADLFTLFCYLAAAFRQGHLFVECLTPHPQQLCDEECTELVLESIKRGFTKIENQVSLPIGVVLTDGRLYTQKAWRLIEQIEEQYHRLAKACLRRVMDRQKVRDTLAALQSQKVLLAEQALAIDHALNAPISCIWGGPGTGKTYTAGWLVKLFLEQHPEAKIALTSPTGKASANLALSIRKAVGEDCSALVAKTLHALLGIRRFGQKSQQEELGFDLILVDESSMMDANLTGQLLRQVVPGARLVFLGDPYQLPPIEPGEPFCAFVASSIASNSPGFLSISKRQEEGAILQLAAFVKNGDADGALACLQNDRSGSIQFFSHESRLKEEFENVKSLYISASGSINAQFEALADLRLLCPLREGRSGVTAINAEILQLHNQTHFEPIIITKNDAHLALTNGQVGILQGDKAYFECDESVTPYRVIPRILLPSYETAFCLSVHKSQGSEFDEVVLALPEGSERFGRKMLYTAITRAKKCFRVIGSEKTLRACIENEGRIITTFLRLSETASCTTITTLA